MTQLRADAPGRAELTEVAPRVFAYVQPDGGWMINNTGAVSGRQSTVMIDTASTEPRNRLWHQALESASTGPVAALINTHHHGDHTYGNWLLPRSATIVAHRQCRTEMLRAGLSVMNLFPDAVYGHVEVSPPTLTFEDQISLWADDTEVQIRFVGPAHTTGDCVVWIPDRGVLFSGDLVFNGGQPLLVEGSAANFDTALATVEQLNPQVVVPGHGPVGGPETLSRMRRYAQWLTGYATQSFQAGHPALEAARRAPLGEFASWSEGERLVANIERAYSELRGEPSGTTLPLAPIVAQMAAYAGHPLTCLA